MATKFNRDSVEWEDIWLLLVAAEKKGDVQVVTDCENAMAGGCAATERCVDAIETAWNASH